MKMGAPKTVFIDDLCRLPSGISLIYPGSWSIQDMNGSWVWCLKVHFTENRIPRKAFFRCDNMDYVCDVIDEDKKEND